jgi:hypothetical protein
LAPLEDDVRNQSIREQAHFIAPTNQVQRPNHQMSITSSTENAQFLRTSCSALANASRPLFAETAFFTHNHRKFREPALMWQQQHDYCQYKEKTNGESWVAIEELLK